MTTTTRYHFNIMTLRMETLVGPLQEFGKFYQDTPEEALEYALQEEKSKIKNIEFMLKQANINIEHIQQLLKLNTYKIPNWKLKGQLDYIRKHGNNQLADEYMYESDLSFEEFTAFNGIELPLNYDPETF